MPHTKMPLSHLQYVDRANVVELRKELAGLGVVVAEVDKKLRYVWIDNPHPDFDVKSVIGKRDDDLISKAEAKALMSLKQKAFDQDSPMGRVLSFKRSDDPRYYSLYA